MDEDEAGETDRDVLICSAVLWLSTYQPCTSRDGAQFILRVEDVRAVLAIAPGIDYWGGSGQGE